VNVGIVGTGVGAEYVGSGVGNVRTGALLGCPEG